MQLTFLSASNGLPLSKTFTATESKAYPLVTEVDSHHIDVQNISEVFDAIKDQSSQGRCLLKGDLKKQLVNESRKGKSDRNSYTQLLVLDVDGLKLDLPIPDKQLTSVHVKLVADSIIAALPEPLQSVSYIAQASASFGRKQTRVSLHIFFMLYVPIPPTTIKLWLINANHASELFEQQIDLSVNGQSLKYPLDISVWSNSKLIFIAPPVFTKGAANPFVNNDERMVYVEKDYDTIDLGPLMNGISKEVNFEQAKKKKDKLRAQAGMSKKSENIRIATVNYHNEEILINPDKVTITIASTDYLPWVCCNINGGDSGAYYFNIESPTYMYNFKDEPIFEIEKADKDFYLSIFDMFDEEIEKRGKAQMPVVVRDFNTDIYYCGLFNPNLNQFNDQYPLTPLAKTSVDSFMMSHGRTPPPFIPDANVNFDPTQETDAINLESVPYSINMYRKTDYMLEPKKHKALQLGTGIELRKSCPLIYTLTHHILGNGDEEFERFINWLAYIYQTRRKAMTAWVLTGVPGTGKGLFYSKILRPLFGESYVPTRTLQNIEEQFNSYMRKALFLIVDEFHMASAQQGLIKIADKLKNQITENTLTIRAMRANQVEVPNYTNFIFLTNRSDAVKIEEGDRRYNIAPRQEQKLDDAHPEVLDNIDNIEKELHKFAGALKSYRVDARMVRTCIVNDAKTEMRLISMSVFDEFCEALKVGNLVYFCDVLQIEVSNLMGSGEVMSAQRHVKSWIAAAGVIDQKEIIPSEVLRVVFHALTEQTPRLNAKEFRKRLDRNGVPSGRNMKKRGREIMWNVTKAQRDELIETYFEQQDKALLVGT